MYLFFSPKSPTEISKLTPQRRHASEPAGFAAVFEVREKLFRRALIRLNLVTALSRFREQCSLEELELKCLEIHNSTATRNWYFPDLTVFFLLGRPGGEEIVNWFDQWRRQNSATPLEHEREWGCYSLPSNKPTHGILDSPQFRSH